MYELTNVWMYVRMYECMHIWMYECVHECMYASTHAFIYIIPCGNIHHHTSTCPWDSLSYSMIVSVSKFFIKKSKYIYHYISLLMVNIQHWFRHPKSETILSDRKLTFTTVLWSGLRLTLRNFYLYMSVLKWGGTWKPWVSILGCGCFQVPLWFRKPHIDPYRSTGDCDAESWPQGVPILP